MKRIYIPSHTKRLATVGSNIGTTDIIEITFHANTKVKTRSKLWHRRTSHKCTGGHEQHGDQLPHMLEDDYGIQREHQEEHHTQVDVLEWLC